MDEGVEEVELGLYVVRGDNIVRSDLPSSSTGITDQVLYALYPASFLPFDLTWSAPRYPHLSVTRQTLIGELDEEADKATDLSAIRAEPMGEIIH